MLAWPLCAAIGVLALLLYLDVLVFQRAIAGPDHPDRGLPAPFVATGPAGLDGTARFAPPAPAGHGILLLTVAGIGVIAVATDLLAVRLRRPAVAGLPLLVLFCVPLTTSVHQGVFGAMTVFGLGMAGYLAMLAVDGRERLRLWGRLVTVWHRGQEPAVAQRGTPNTKELAAAGRRIGVAAVVIALFVPLLVPGLRDHKLFSGGGSGSGPLVTLPNPLVQMNSELRRTDPVRVLSYQTSRPGPAVPPGLRAEHAQHQHLDAGPHRWRGAARREAARESRGSCGAPVPQSESTKITLARGLTTGPRQASFLPLPYPRAPSASAGTGAPTRAR